MPRSANPPTRSALIEPSTIEATSQGRRGFYEAVRRELGIPIPGRTDVFEWQMTKHLEVAMAPAPALPTSADPD